MKNKFCFVILHYNTINDTKKCIESILNLDGSVEAGIWVLDNGSQNGSGEQLIELYKYFEQVSIVQSKVNLGFSKGNNEAYSLAKQIYDPEYMIVCNSDIEFKQKNTLKLIDEIYIETQFQVFGPDIYIPNVKFHANPLAKDAISVEVIQNRIAENEKKLSHIKSSYWIEFVSSLKIRCIATVRALLHKERRPEPRLYNVVLQGACYVFSRDYIEKQNKIFFPLNSFYFEEYFVFAECKRKGYKIVYDPCVQVIHNESSSTKQNLSSQVERMKFRLTNLNKSMKSYCEVYGDES